MERLDGQVIAISGAGGGLGKAMALDMAARGASVVINDYGTNIEGTSGGDPTPAQSTLEEIEASDGKACISVADVGTEAGANSIIDCAIRTFGRINGVVHNACVFPPQCAFEDLSRENFERTIRVTVYGAWGLVQAAWPHFKKQKSGRVVLIQSAAGFYGRLGMPSYGIAKSSFIGFTSYLAQEGAPYNILVNNVSPVGWSRAPASEGDSLAFMQQATPAAHLGPLVSLLLHPAFDRTGLLLHSGGGVITRMFVPETRGIALKSEELTPNNIYARLDDIIDETGYRTRSTTDEVGIDLMEAISRRDQLA